LGQRIDLASKDKGDNSMCVKRSISESRVVALGNLPRGTVRLAHLKERAGGPKRADELGCAP